MPHPASQVKSPTQHISSTTHIPLYFGLTDLKIPQTWKKPGCVNVGDGWQADSPRISRIIQRLVFTIFSSRAQTNWKKKQQQINEEGWWPKSSKIKQVFARSCTSRCFSKLVNDNGNVNIWNWNCHFPREQSVVSD